MNYAIPVYRVLLVCEGDMQGERPRLSCSADLAQIIGDYLVGVDREHFVVVLLNRKNRVLGVNTVSIGNLTASVVHLREVFKQAILGNAAAVAFGHNHPSGDPAPSQEDKVLTQRLAKAGKLLGIQVLDHVIVGDGCCYSFSDEGLLA